MTALRDYIEPEPTPETQAFWDAARDGRFLLRRCRACGRCHWYPRTLCPFCASTDTEWIEGSGRGTVYSYSVMRRAPVLYVMAYVTLAEGPTMMTNLVDCDPDAIRIGDPVRLRFVTTPGGWPLPMFAPAGDAA
jgi:uncharacterized OB-fold protein